jgi:hypothetical protein
MGIAEDLGSVRVPVVNLARSAIDGTISIELGRQNVEVLISNMPAESRAVILEFWARLTTGAGKFQKSCKNCRENEKCTLKTPFQEWQENKRETVVLSFGQAADVTLAILDKVREEHMPLEEACAITRAASELLDPCALAVEGESQIITDAKDFRQYFENKKVVEQL